MADFGIKIGTVGADARTADDKDLLLSTKYPFAKLDRTNEVSFQNVRLTFASNPPEPSAPAIYKRTLVYQFKHGYDYVPSFWTLYQVESSPSPNYTPYSYGGGLIAATTAFDAAWVEFDADEENINIYVVKYKDTFGGASANNIIGAIVRMRIYVFAEDLGL